MAVGSRSLYRWSPGAIVAGLLVIAARFVAAQAPGPQFPGFAGPGGYNDPNGMSPSGGTGRFPANNGMSGGYSNNGMMPPSYTAPSEPSLSNRKPGDDGSAAAQAQPAPQYASGEPVPAAIGSGLSAPAANAVPRRDETVVDVRVAGNRAVQLKRITTHIKTRAGRPYDPQLVSEDVRRLLQTHLFVTIDTKYQRSPEGGLIVIYNVVERPTLRYVRYVGNKIKDRHLTKQTNLKPGDSLDPYMVTEARQRIEEYYHGKGFNRARCTIIEGDKPGDRGAIFLIDEGEKQRVWQTEFVGNNIATDSRLRTQIKSKKPILWIIGGQLDRKKIDEDVDRLRSYYQGLGFFHVRIGRELEFNEKQDWVTVRFVIDEGPRSKVNNVALIGNTKYTTEELFKEVKLKSGDYFDRVTVNSDVAVLQDKYGHVGYIFAAVEPEVRVHEQPGTVDLVYHVQEGDRYRIGRIDIHIDGDNPRTRYHTVLNRISVRPGQIADIRQLRDSERRLKGSGMFLNKPADGIEPKLTWGQPDLDGDGEPDNPAASTASSSNGAGRGGRGGGGRGGRSGFRGQSPDDDPEAEVWRPGPGDTDKPINVVLFEGRTEESAEAPLRTTVVRAQSPDSSSFDSMPRQPMPASAPYGGYPSNANPYGAQPGANRTTAAPNNAPRYQPPQYQLPAYQPPAGQLPQYQSPNPYAVAAPSVMPPAGAGQASAPAASAGATPYGAVVQTQYQQPTGYGANNGTVGPTLAGPPGVYGGAAPTAAPPGVLPPPGYDKPGQLNPDGTSGGPLFNPRGPTEILEEPTHEVPVVARVQEAQTGRLMVGAGINSSSGLVGQLTIEEQNFDIRRIPTSWEELRSGKSFRGGGQQLRIQAMPGTVLSYYSATFREPYLFDTLVSLSLGASFYNRFFQNWSEQRGGGTAGLGYQFTPDLQGQFRLRGEDVIVYNPTVPTPAQLQAVVGSSQLFTLRWDLIHDTRDSPFLATQGHYFDLGYEQGVWQFVYPRFTIDARQHFLLKQRPDRSGRQTLTLMTNFGWSGDNTPLYEHFFAGGYQTMRGFYFRGASPLVNGVQVGGNFMWINTVEYMFPIMADDSVRGVIFSDFGTVEPNMQLSASDYRVAIGAGVRLNIPAMGPAPIAVDFAVPVHMMSGDMVQNVSFFVGTMR